MDILSNLKYAKGSRKKKKRIGRGQGSGYGGTSTKGHKGAKSRAGYKNRAWFEGGQMPLQRRIPKFGFKNINRTDYNIINVGNIQQMIDDGKIKGTNLDLEFFLKSKILRIKNNPLKILGNGELKSKIEVSANSFSKTAKEKIEKLGGKALVV